MQTRNFRRKKKHLSVKKQLTRQQKLFDFKVIVYKSHANFYAQVFDMKNQKTLASVSSKKLGVYGGNIQAAKEVGKLMAQKINQLKINKIVFDRSGYLYHGRVKAFAEVLRQEGFLN